MAKAPEIRIGYCNKTLNRYIESGTGATYRCYGVALNDAAAKKMAREVRQMLKDAA